MIIYLRKIELLLLLYPETLREYGLFPTLDQFFMLALEPDI